MQGTLPCSRSGAVRAPHSDARPPLGGSGFWQMTWQAAPARAQGSARAVFGRPCTAGMRRVISAQLGVQVGRVPAASEGGASAAGQPAGAGAAAAAAAAGAMHLGQLAQPGNVRPGMQWLQQAQAGNPGAPEPSSSLGQAIVHVRAPCRSGARLPGTTCTCMQACSLAARSRQLWARALGACPAMPTAACQSCAACDRMHACCSVQVQPHAVLCLPWHAACRLLLIPWSAAVPAPPRNTPTQLVTPPASMQAAPACVHGFTPEPVPGTCQPARVCAGHGAGRFPGCAPGRHPAVASNARCAGGQHAGCCAARPGRPAGLDSSGRPAPCRLCWRPACACSGPIRLTPLRCVPASGLCPCRMARPVCRAPKCAVARQTQLAARTDKWRAVPAPSVQSAWADSHTTPSLYGFLGGASSINLLPVLTVQSVQHPWAASWQSGSPAAQLKQLLQRRPLCGRQLRHLWPKWGTPPWQPAASATRQRWLQGRLPACACSCAPAALRQRPHFRLYASPPVGSRLTARQAPPDRPAAGRRQPAGPAARRASSPPSPRETSAHGLPHSRRLGLPTHLLAARRSARSRTAMQAPPAGHRGSLASASAPRPRAGTPAPMLQAPSSAPGAARPPGHSSVQPGQRVQIRQGQPRRGQQVQCTSSQPPRRLSRPRPLSSCRPSSAARMARR